MSWRRSLPHLDQAQIATQKAIDDLEKAFEELRVFVEGNKSAESNPVRQQHLESIGKRLVNARAEKAEILVLDPAEARQLIDAIDVTTVIGLRDRALIGLMVYSFARIGAAIGMSVEDVYSQNRRLWVRLHEKGGKQHAMPCHHNLEAYLHEYIDGAGLAAEPKALLFQTYNRASGQLTGNPLPEANAYAMIQRRAKSGGIITRVGNHTFRATGVTAYLKNGGTLEKAAQMANHASTRTTQLYDRRAEEGTLDEVERILV